MTDYFDQHQNDTSTPMWERNWTGAPAPSGSPASPPPPSPGPAGQRREPTAEEIGAALKAFFGAPNYAATLDVAERHADILLTLGAVRLVIAQIVEAEDPKVRVELQFHSDLLLIAREYGVTAAREWLREELQARQAATAMQHVAAYLESLPPAERQRNERLLSLLGDESLSDAQRQHLARDFQALLDRAEAYARQTGGAAPTPTSPESPAAPPLFVPAPPPLVVPPSVSSPGLTAPPASNFSGAPPKSGEVFAALNAFFSTSDWQARFDFIRQRPDLLLNDLAINEIQRQAVRARQQRDLDAAADLEECARVLTEARAQGVDAALRAFTLRQQNASGLVDVNAPTLLIRNPNLAATPSNPPAAPATLPMVTHEQEQGIRGLLAQSGALDAATRRLLLIWLGESGENAPVAEIAAAVRRALALLS